MNRREFLSTQPHWWALYAIGLWTETRRVAAYEPSASV